MRKATFDPIQFKHKQRRQWDRVAAGWARWEALLEPQWQPVNACLFKLARLQPGQTVLDVATGSGEPALNVAQLVGLTGQVIAVDQSREMLALAQKRAHALELTNIKFRQMDAEALDLPLGNFDAVLCRWGLMFLPDLAITLAQIRQLLKPNGCFATAVWDVSANVPLMSLAFELAQTMLQLPLLAPGMPSLFGLAGGGLEHALAKSGFTGVSTERITVMVRFPSPDAFVQYIREVNTPWLAVLTQQTDEVQTAFWQQLTLVLQPYLTPTGTIQMANTALCGVGQRVD